MSYYQIPHGSLYTAEQQALAEAETDQQRGAISRAVQWLWSTKQVLTLGETFTINSPHGSRYYTNGVACDCQCNHSRYACWPREAARLIKRMQAMNAAPQVDATAGIAELFPS